MNVYFEYMSQHASKNCEDSKVKATNKRYIEQENLPTLKLDERFENLNLLFLVIREL